jgi:hypothetical protein
MISEEELMRMSLFFFQKIKHFLLDDCTPIIPIDQKRHSRFSKLLLENTKSNQPYETTARML